MPTTKQSAGRAGSGQSLASDGLRRRWDSASLEPEIQDIIRNELSMDAVVDDDEDDDIHGGGFQVPATPNESTNFSDREDDDGDDDEDLKSVLFSADVDLETLTKGAVVLRKLKSMRKWTLCHFQKLPNWLQDNECIKTGHRPPLNSFRDCLQSVFRLHNETGNIWTHLIPGLFYLLKIALLVADKPKYDWMEQIFLGLFYATAVICFALSTLYHTVNCHSEIVSHLFSKFDYCGIAVLIMGSYVPWIWFAFYCDHYYRTIYLAFVLTLGVCSIVVSLWKKFSESHYRPFRAAVFLTFGLSAIVPAFHYGYIDGAAAYSCLALTILMGVLYVCGALIYASRIPERFWPGKFDMWFNSHQIFHVFVIGGVVVHEHCIFEFLAKRLAFDSCFDFRNF